MLRVRANAANQPVWTMPMAASPISGDDSGKGLIEMPEIHKANKVTLYRL